MARVRYSNFLLRGTSFTQGRDLALFVGNVNKVKMPSEIKLPLISVNNILNYRSQIMLRAVLVFAKSSIAEASCSKKFYRNFC